MIRTPKILQTISTLHILTAFCITETIIGILFIVFSSLFAFFQQKNQDTLIEQSVALIELSGNRKIV